MSQNKIPKKREHTAARIVKALEETQGLMTVAAKRAGVSYATIYRYVSDFPSVRQAKELAQERLLDFAEGKLIENIKAGDNTAILFYLKTQGKRRGYVERTEWTGKDGEPIEVKEITELTDEQLAVIAAKEIVNNASRGSKGTTDKKTS